VLPREDWTGFNDYSDSCHAGERGHAVCRLGHFAGAGLVARRISSVAFSACHYAHRENTGLLVPITFSEILRHQV